MFLLRYWRIVSFFGWLVFKIIFNDFFLKWIGLGSIPRKSRQKRFTSYARAFRTTALKMGGVLIKVGQFLSSRIDVLPDYVVKELSNLQDEVPPEKLDKIINVVEAEFGKGIGIVFKEFAPMPVAAASLGQVHSAVLFSGEKVVVKVQRCQIEKIVATDLKALRTVVRWLRHWHTISDRVDVIEDRKSVV
jgi:predicted unusual protein kinase regulating ubiquinone biosynthesis (AarF/ABC1/UbiB family)